MSKAEHIWQQAETAYTFLDEVRGGIPLAAEQIDLIVRVVSHALPRVDRLLDLGCGDGILGRTLMIEHPQAAGVFLDFSETMIAAARQRVDSQRATCLIGDFREPEWTKLVAASGPFDLALSGFSIHHLTNERKRALYGEVFELLAPGGLFLNLEHVAGTSAWANAAFRELFVDSLVTHHRRLGGTKAREEIRDTFENRPSRVADVLAPVDLQCQWLRELGYIDVDCHFKLFELALFGGRKA